MLDTGATYHMTSNVENLNQTRPYNGEEKIIIGNGQGLEVKHVGSTVPFTYDRFLHLKNVLMILL